MDIESEIADTLIEQPVGFSIYGESYFLHPPTLGCTYAVNKVLAGIGVDMGLIAVNPYAEALRLCKEKKGQVCTALAYHTLQRKEDILSPSVVATRAEELGGLDTKELATLFMLAISSDNTDRFIHHLGLDKERDERRRITNAKDNGGSITYGGRSIYGTLIDFACQRYGWTMDYVLWSISYANLKMLMADAITTIYLTEEERKKLHIFDDKEVINADDPKNKELIRKMIFND